MNYKHPIKHGTSGGYRAHFRHGEVMCEACRDAERRRCGRQPQRQAQCGTRSGYHRHRRLGEPTCEPCRAACTKEGREGRRRRKARGLATDSPSHGITGYRNWGCRCEVCTAANTAGCAKYRGRRKLVTV